MLDGKPLGGAKVIFQPKKGRAAAGITDGDGRYSLTTLEKHDGAVPGLYRVIISTEAPSEPKKEGNPQVTLSAKYSNPEASELMCEVAPDTNVMNFDLTD